MHRGITASPFLNQETRKMRQFNLWVHDASFSALEIVINPTVFPVNTRTLTPGRFCGRSAGSFPPKQHPKVCWPSSGDRQRNPHQTTAAAGISRRLITQISIASHVATLFNLQARTDVLVRKVTLFVSSQGPIGKRRCRSH